MQLIKKVKKHLNFEALRESLTKHFNEIPDNRQTGKTHYQIHDALMSAFACMYFQDPSLLQFQKRLQEAYQQNNLKTIFSVKEIPKETQMRELIDQVDSEYLRPIYNDYFAKLQRSKHLEEYQLLPGLYYAPMDGTQYFQSKQVHCDHCLTKNKPAECYLEIIYDKNKTTDCSKERSEAFNNGQSVYQLIYIREDSSCRLLHYKSKKAKGIKIPLNKIEGLRELLTDKDDLALDATEILNKLTAYEASINKKKEISYSHQALQIGIMHPQKRQVIPLMPEEIKNSDGTSKQDCEMNAAKRLVAHVRQDHRQLGVIIGGDGLFSKQPIIEQILNLKMHYLFVAKPDDHKYMMEWLDAYSSLNTHQANGIKRRQLRYRWMNDVPLNSNDETVKTNYLYFEMVVTDDEGNEKIVYKNSWVTDIYLDEKTVIKLVEGGRCRWKVENEMFNTLKNQGYELEHSYGHGKENLCYNFYLLTLLAFFFHQIFELTDLTYQACRTKFGSKRHMWETLRAYIKILIFTSWQQLMDFALKPTNYLRGEPAEVKFQAI